MHLLIAILLTAPLAGDVAADADSTGVRVAQAIAAFEPFPPRKPTDRSAEDRAAQPDRGRAARIARALVPEGDLPLERVDWFCGLVLRLALTNPTLIYAHVDAHAENPSEGAAGVRLTGAASSPCVSQLLTSAMKAVGVAQVTDEIRQLPDRMKLGDKLFGACRVPAVLTRVAPDERAGLQTELLFGEPVFLLDREGDYLLLHAGDGYWGWVRSEVIATMTADEFARYIDASEFVATHDIDTGGVRIPRGARVRFACVNADFGVVVPGGDYLSPGTESEWLTEITDSVGADRRVLAALDLIGTPYVFGGRGPAGLDCSGLLTNVAARCAEPVARDASQQALAGRITATAWHREGMRRGDQVFFIDPSGKVYHAGIAISRTHILHAAPPGVQIGTFVRGDRLFDERIARDFFIAKRP